MGVVLGFALSIIYTNLKEYRKRRRLIKALKNELLINLDVTFKKEDILNQIIKCLPSKKILTGRSVKCCTVIYDTYISELSPYLKSVQRVYLHVIYSRLKNIDNYMDEFEDAIKNDIKEKIMKDVYKVYEIRLGELKISYQYIRELINEYISKKYRDNFKKIKSIS